MDIEMNGADNATTSPTPVVKTTIELLSLSDEIIELIVQQVDRHDDLPNLRLSCKKLLALSERYMYRNVVVTLAEDVNSQQWRSKLETMPKSIKLIKYLTIANQNVNPTSKVFYKDVVPCANSYRIQRWGRLEEAAHNSKEVFEKSAFLRGSLFHWDIKLGENQLISFRWRHATTLSYELLCKIMTSQAGSLQELEISMVTPPSANSVGQFSRAIEPKAFPKLKKLIYRGLSHTEPIPQNMPARGGRFRMLRPLFRKTYEVLEELTLSQDHCISQVGKTPLINGRNFDSFLCSLDEIYHHTHDPCQVSVPNVTLKVRKLELGGFKVGALFDCPSIPVVAPRVRISLPHLHHLVLNECDGLGILLKELVVRKDDVHLKEVGFRIKEQMEDDHTQDWEEVADSLKAFLLSLKGLEVLSILWHGDNAPKATKFSSIISRHYKTLQVYSFATRCATDHDRGVIFRHTTTPHAEASPWFEIILDQKKRAGLREIGIDLPDMLCTNGYPALRLLSQHRNTLRTVHIRNFPLFADPVSWAEVARYWRDYDGTVSRLARQQAAEFAELIALPYFRLPEDVEENLSKEVLQDFKLRELGKVHADIRDNRIAPGFSMPQDTTGTSSSDVDLTPYVMTYKHDTDFVFSRIKQMMEAGTTSQTERKYYDGFVARTRRILGYTKPSRHEKPKLRLLIIGDWRYRDQLNLTGPRTWNPEAWSVPRDAASRTPAGAIVDDEDREVEDDDASDDSDLYHDQWHRLRDNFYKEFDVSLLPIFFKIDWRAEQGKDNIWRWKAKARPLPQTSLEGYGALGDVRSLDFAWQN